MNQLLGVFFAEFDPITGPKLAFQEPALVLPVDVFEALHDYVITKPQLCGRVVIVKAFERCIMGYSVLLENTKYARNALQFNFGFVLRADGDCACFEPALRKIGHYLTALELESEFVSRDKTKTNLKRIAAEVFESLSTTDGCAVRIDNANTLHLKIFPTLPDPPLYIPEHKVPVLLCDLSQYPTHSWDIALQQILPHIDGTNHIKRISQLSKVNITACKKSIQHLLFFRAITLVDVFQYCNIYVATATLTNFLKHNVQEQERIVRLISNDISAAPASFGMVCLLYAKLRPGLSFLKFCEQNDLSSYNINDKRFILYGLVKGFVRCMQGYPVAITHVDTFDVITKNFSKKYFDGTHSFSEICCTYGTSQSELETLIKRACDENNSEPPVLVLWK